MVDQRRVAELLGQTELFRRCPRDWIEGLAARTSKLRFGRGDTVLRKGDAGTAMYVIAEGGVKIELTSNDGRTMLLATLVEGDAFGEIAVLDGGPRSASVVTITDSELIQLDRDGVLASMRADPAALEGVLVAMAEAFRGLTEHASDLVFLDVPRRVAKLLLRSVEEAGTTEEPVSVDLRLTQRELAQLVGGSRQTVNQTLRHFASRGFIEVRGGAIVVLDIDGLRHRAGL